MNKVAIIIPCLNEEKTIAAVISDIQKNIQCDDYMIYVYDNGSTDRTRDVCKKLGVIVRVVDMRGKGNVIKQAFKEVEAECYIMIDGDYTYSAGNKELATIQRLIHEGYSMVCCNRLNSDYFRGCKNLISNVGNRFLVWYINKRYECNIKDVLTGFRGFSRGFVKSIDIKSEGFDIETEITLYAIRKNVKIASIDTSYIDRPLGSKSKIKVFRDGYLILKRLMVGG